jgi:hypothetical protein
MSIAGSKDALSLSLMGLSVQVVNPLLWSIPTEYSAALMGAGTILFGYERTTDLYKRVVLDSVIKNGPVIESDKAPPECFADAGYRLGVIRDTLMPLDVSENIAIMHMAVTGQSGVGKTTLSEYILAQQTAMGGGWTFLNGKIDEDAQKRMQYLAKIYKREHELFILDVSNPDNSHSYSPVQNGDSDEKSSRVMNLQPSTDNSPGADHYRQSAAYAFNVIFQVLDHLGLAYTMEDIVILMQSSKALLDFERQLPDGNVKAAYSSLLENYKKRGKKGVEIDIDRFKNNIGGMLGRLAQFSSGKFGAIFNTYTPQINLFDIIKDSKMLYISMPTMAKATSSMNLAKMLISDFKTALAGIQELPVELRPKPYHLFMADEFASYGIDEARTLFEQGRSAHVIMCPLFQSFSQLDGISDTFKDITAQNTWVKVFFKHGSKEAAEYASEMMGTDVEFIETITSSGNQGTSSENMRTTPTENESGAGGLSKSWREQEGFRVHPDKIMGLDRGQAIVSIGSDVYSIATPLINFPKNLKTERIVNHPGKKTVGKPMNLVKRYKDYLMSDSDGNNQSSAKEAY